jgi:hypothetical protein
MGYNVAKYNDAVDRVKALSDPSLVESIDDHYAVYWDELGLFVKLRDEALDADVISLRNKILFLLTEILPDGNPYFTWGVGFRRWSKTIEVLYPRDEIRDVTDTLKPI